MNKKKQGYKDLITGLIFVGSRKDCKNGEYWLTPEKYALYLERKRRDIKKFRQLNPEKNKETARKSYQKNKEKKSKKNKEYRIKNREYLSQKNKEWVRKNKDHVRKYAREYQARRGKEDRMFTLTRRCGGRIRDAFRLNGYTKRSRSSQLIGCEWESLRLHIENQFVDGMTWENRHLWHIDHIIPMASAKTVEELEALCHYTNLQPLWAGDNMSKGAKLPLDNTCQK